MGYLNQIGGSSGSGNGERGPRGIAGRGIQSITTQDNNNGTINLTINYDDGTPSDTFVNSLVSDTLIQLEKLTLEGTNNTVKFSINQADETVIYKCDTVAGINIMKQLLIGNGIKKLGLLNDEIVFIDASGEHFKIFSESSGSITFKSLNGAVSKMLMKDLNDNEIYDISDTGVNYYPTQVNYGKVSDIGGVKFSVKNTGITAQRDMSIFNSNLIVNNGIDIFKVNKMNDYTEIFKVFTRDIISEDLNFLDTNELLVMKLDTVNRNLELNNTQFTMISGEDITFINEPSTKITSILQTKTPKIIIPDTVLNIVDTNETPIMQVKTDNNVDIYSQLNIKSSGGVAENYTDFPFTTLSNPDGTNYGFQCGTHFLISNTPLICTGVMDFLSQYSAQVITTCVISGDMSAFNLSVDPDGRFQFSFTAAVSGPFAFAFSPEMAVQIGMSSNPPNPSKIIFGGTGVGNLYMLFQTNATAGSTYTFQSDGLFGNSVPNNAIEITTTSISSVGDISIESNNLNITSTGTTSIESNNLNITTNNLSVNNTNTIDINTGIFDITTTGTTTINSGAGITISGLGGAIIENTYLRVDNVAEFKKTVSIGTEAIPTFGGEILRVFNPATTEEVFNVNSTFTYIKTLNDITNPSNKGCLYYSNETTGALSFFPRADYDCSFITWKSNKPVWRIPYMSELVNNPYINDALGTGTNIPTTITGWTELIISDNNIYFNSAPSPTFFTRTIAGNTTIRYVGFPFASNDYKFRVSYTVSLSGFNNQTVELALYKNGLRVDTTINKMVFSSNSEYEVMSRIAIIPLLKNDTLSVRINSNQPEVTVSNYNMLIETVC
jgi:hypothetical protein